MWKCFSFIQSRAAHTGGKIMPKVYSKKDKENLKIFFSFMVIILVTGIVLTIALYTDFKNTASDIVQSYAVEELSQASYNIDSIFETAKSTILQYYLNPAVLKLMNYSNLDELESVNLLYQVNQININMPYANTIYIYNGTAGKFYYRGLEYPVNTFPDKDIVSRLKDFRNIKKLSPIPRKISVSDPYFIKSNNMYSFVFFDDQNSAIILNISQEYMESTIKSMNSDIVHEVIITDSDGNVMLGNGKYKYLQNITKDGSFGDIFGNSSKSGFKIQNIDGRKYLVSYVSSNILDWKYIRITPYEKIMGKFRNVLVVTLLISVVAMLLALLATKFFSNRLYDSFKRKLSELEKKYVLEKNIGYDRKQQFLRKIAEHGFDGKKSNGVLDKYGVQFDLSKSFLIILFRIDNYSAYSQKILPSDRELFAYGFINIINELAGPAFVHEAVNLGQGNVCVIINTAFDDYQSTMVKIESVTASIQKQTFDFFELSYSAVAGDILEDISEIPNSLSECREAMNYKVFNVSRSIINITSIREIKKKKAIVPALEISSLCDNLLLGKTLEARETYEKIEKEAKNYSFTFFQMTMLQIDMSVKQALEKHNGLADRVSFNRIFKVINDLPDLDSTDALSKSFYQLFDDIAGAVEASKNISMENERYEHLLTEVNVFLQSEYGNSLLNPDMISEHFGITPEYLRRLFKKASGESLGDFINNYRLSKACKLLTDTDDMVNAIAFKTGFSNINYFYNIFKKSRGVTPSEYRYLNLQKEQNISHDI
jgi:two-component system response regulator YesN